MYKMITKKYPGVTSLLFVLVIGLILVVMVAGIAALTIREQQQASNTELSNRALQTAQAGIKQVAQKLESTPSFSSVGCKDQAAFFDNLKGNNQEISCMVIQSVFGASPNPTFTAYAQKDRAQRLFMGPAFFGAPVSAPVSPAYLSIKWNNPDLGDVAGADANYTRNLYPTKDYQNASTLELSIIYWRNDIGITNDDIAIKKFLIVPGNNNNASNPIKSTCSGTTGYVCSTTPATGQNGFDVKAALALPTAVSSYNFVVIIAPRYKGTHIEVSATAPNASGVQELINMKSAYVQIDSTAKAGNLYRRVKASKLISTIGGSEYIFDGPIFSARGESSSSDLHLCKDFTAKPNGTNYVLVTGTPDCNSSLTNPH